MNSIFSSFTIRVLTTLLNTVKHCTVIGLFKAEFNCRPTAILPVFVFRLLFSIPGLFLFWIILLLNWESAVQFRIPPNAGFIVPSLSLLVYMLPVGMDKDQLLFQSLCIAIAVITSVKLRHSILISITAKNKNLYYV